VNLTDILLSQAGMELMSQAARGSAEANQGRDLGKDVHRELAGP
jgi:hypothetical protein